MDTLKGAALILAFLGVIAICATWIEIWDATWQAAVEPTRASIYKGRLGPTQCLISFWLRENGCRLI